MRTGFIGLNSYLHKIKRVESPIAAGESGYQTVSHILGDCYLEGFIYLRRTPPAAVLTMQCPCLLNNPVLITLQDATAILKLGHRRANTAAGCVRRR